MSEYTRAACLWRGGVGQGPLFRNNGEKSLKDSNPNHDSSPKFFGLGLANPF